MAKGKRINKLKQIIICAIYVYQNDNDKLFIFWEMIAASKLIEKQNMLERSKFSDKRVKQNKRKIAPFLVYPTVNYDGYLILKSKNKQTKRADHRPSTAKIYNIHTDQIQSNSTQKYYHNSYHVNIPLRCKPPSPWQKKQSMQYFHSILGSQKTRENQHSKTFYVGESSRKKEGSNPPCFTNNLLVEKIKETTSIEPSPKGQFVLKGRSKALIKGRNSLKKEKKIKIKGTSTMSLINDKYFIEI